MKIAGSGLVAVLCVWIGLYCLVEHNAPERLQNLALAKLVDETYEMDTLFHEVEVHAKAASIAGTTRRWFGVDPGVQPQALAAVIRDWQRLPGTHGVGANVRERNFLVPYRWYASYAAVMFLGLAVPFFVIPICCVRRDLQELAEAQSKFQEAIGCAGGKSLSTSLAEDLKKFKNAIRDKADRYIEFPVWFVVFAGFELAVGRTTLADDAAKLTIWFTLLMLFFGYVIIRIGLTYERTFTELKKRCGDNDSDNAWLAQHTPVQFFDDFRKTSILGLAAWFAGASIIFGLVSQAVDLLGS